MAGLATKTVLVELSRLNKNKDNLSLEERLHKFAEIYADAFSNYPGDIAKITAGNLDPIRGRLNQLIQTERAAIAHNPARKTAPLNGLLAFKETLDILSNMEREQPELATSDWKR